MFCGSRMLKYFVRTRATFSATNDRNASGLAPLLASLFNRSSTRMMVKGYPVLMRCNFIAQTSSSSVAVFKLVNVRCKDVSCSRCAVKPSE
jgi:hypothetical protein